MGLETTDPRAKTAKFVVLRGRKEGNRFYSTNIPGNDPKMSAKGEHWYDVIGYANSGEEALATIRIDYRHPLVVNDDTD